MDIKRYLITEACIFTNYDASHNKATALTNICRIIADHNNFDNSISSQVVSAILAREKFSSTAIGKGLAIPHAAISSIEHGCVGWFTLKTPIDFDSLDGDSVNFVFIQIGSVGDGNDIWSKVMGAAARILHNKDRVDSLLNASSSDEFRWLLNRYL